MKLVKNPLCNGDDIIDPKGYLIGTIHYMGSDNARQFREWWIRREHPPYVTVTYGMRGWFAVLLTWNDEHGGFYEPFNTGPGSYKTSEDAQKEARLWAEAEGLEFKL
jgi:hypothetical protein